MMLTSFAFSRHVQQPLVCSFSDLLGGSYERDRLMASFIPLSICKVVKVFPDVLGMSQLHQ